MRAFRHPVRFVMLAVLVLLFVGVSAVAYAAPVTVGIRGRVTLLDDRGGC